MCFNISLLGKSIITNNKDDTKKIINNIIQSDYSGIKTLIIELNDLKEVIDSLEDKYKLLMDYMPNTLDHKITTVDKNKKHIKRLNSLHTEQKTIFVDIVKLFIELGKRGLKK